MSEHYRYSYFQWKTFRKLVKLEPREASWCLYLNLVKRAYEKGCPISAKHIERMAEKERQLFDAGTICVWLADDKELLFDIIDKMENAEMVSKLNRCDSTQRASELLYELVQLFDPVRVKYDVLLRHIYAIILKICKKALLHECSNGTRQHIAQIYLSCAQFYHKVLNEFKMAVKYYKKTIALAMGEPWKSKELDEMLNYVTMRESAARNLCELFIEQSKKVLRYDGHLSIDLSKKALDAASQVGIENDLMPYWNAYLNLAKNLQNHSDWTTALKVIQKIPDFLRQNKNPKYDVKKLKLQLYKAYCYIHFERPSEAMEEANQALPLAVKGGYSEQEAEIYCCLGKLHSQRHLENTQARLVFEKARDIYERLGDTEGIRTCRQLLGKLSCEYRWPLQVEQQKLADTEYCSRHALLKWQLQCKPYWTTMGDHVWKHEKDESYCLREKEIIQKNEDEEYYKQSNYKGVKISEVPNDASKDMA